MLVLCLQVYEMQKVRLL